MAPQQVNYLRHEAHRTWGHSLLALNANPRLLWDWIRELNKDRTADAHQHYRDGLIDPLKRSAACCHDSERTIIIMGQNLESSCNVIVKRFFVLYSQEMHQSSA